LVHRAAPRLLPGRRFNRQTRHRLSDLVNESREETGCQTSFRSHCGHHHFLSSAFTNQPHFQLISIVIEAVGLWMAFHTGVRV